MNLTNIVFFALLNLTSHVPEDHIVPLGSRSNIIWAEPEYEFIHNEEPIISKIYVTAVFKNGERITIPVVNGYLPAIKMGRSSSGHKVRHFYYDSKIKHDGDLEVIYEDELEKKDVELEKRNLELGSLQKRVQKLENSVQSLKNTVSEMQHTIKNKSSITVKENSDIMAKNKPSPSMKRPSEFDEKIYK